MRKSTVMMLAGLVLSLVSCGTDDVSQNDGNTDVRKPDAGMMVDEGTTSDLSGWDLGDRPFYSVCILGSEAPLAACLDTDTLDFGEVEPGSRVTRRFAIENEISEPIFIDDFRLSTSRSERFATEIFKLNNVGARVPITLPNSIRSAERLFVDIAYTADEPGVDLPIDSIEVDVRFEESTETALVPFDGNNGACPMGTGDCDPEVAGCESDVQTDAQNCGGCGAEFSCGMNNLCVDGQCVIGNCPSLNLADCDGDFTNGCETSIATDAENCGGCGALTPSGTPNDLYICPGEAELNAPATCNLGQCGVGMCLSGFDDCGPDAGCETDVTTVDNCGGCGNLPGAIGAQFRCNDVFPNVQTTCDNGQCNPGNTPMCQPGWYDLDNDIFTNGCEYFCLGNPANPDLPDPQYQDANCDGIDGDINDAVFVSPLGRLAGTGVFGDPMSDLNAAISQAAVTGKNVYVAGGAYTSPTVNLADGVSIYAGFDAATWARGAGNAGAVQHNGTVTSGRIIGVLGSGITSPTRVERMSFQTTAAGGSGISNYGMHCTSCTALELVDVTIVAGPGSNGNSGAPGTNGRNGTPGQPGGAIPGGACDDNGCGPAGGGGGASPIGANGGAGGAGGNSGGLTGGCGGATNGVAGSKGSPSATGGIGGAGGAQGDGGGNGVGGGGGPDGSRGSNGPAGVASVQGGFWGGAGGQSGGSGTNGAGGGGGGGGGAHACTFCDNGRGNGGGGGGGGAEGATGGGGGSNGGGSFGLFLVSSTGIQLTNCTISSDDGGDGGAGRNGGTGGNGGAGGAGPDPCASKGGGGGVGGVGGDGGDGGHGGGGVGGPSYAVYRTGTNVSLISNTLSHGQGGTGGVSSGISGASGLSGNAN